MSIIQYVIAASFALFAALAAWVSIRFILHTKLVSLFVDTPDHRKVHSAPIPRVGGIAIILAMLAATLAWYALSPRIGAAPVPNEVFFSILAAAIGIGALGFLDDSRFVNIRVRHKLVVVVTLAIATVFVLGAHPGAISMFGIFVIPESVGKVIAVLWIIGLINAYNLVDGLDGFAGTISILSLAGIAAVSVIAGRPSAAALSLFALGAVAGFMVHNAPPARVFMGDTGSCFLGYVIALLTIRAASMMGDGGKVPVVMPLLAGIPILEVFVTILRRYLGSNERGIGRTLKYIVTADSSHLHHRFLFRGFSHLETCILVGVLSATIVGGAVCAALAPLPYLPWIAAYLMIHVAVSLYKLGLGGRFGRMASRRLAGVLETSRSIVGINVDGDTKVIRIDKDDDCIDTGNVTGNVDTDTKNIRIDSIDDFIDTDKTAGNVDTGNAAAGIYIDSNADDGVGGVSKETGVGAAL